MSARKSNKKLVARLAWVVLFIVLLSVTLIDKEKLPASWQKNSGVIDMYAKRDALFGRVPATSPEAEAISAPVTMEKPGTGYSDGDRNKMDELISKGAEDH